MRVDRLNSLGMWRADAKILKADLWGLILGPGSLFFQWLLALSGNAYSRLPHGGWLADYSGPVEQVLCELGGLLTPQTFFLVWPWCILVFCVDTRARAGVTCVNRKAGLSAWGVTENGMGAAGKVKDWQKGHSNPTAAGLHRCVGFLFLLSSPVSRALSCSPVSRAVSPRAPRPRRVLLLRHLRLLN